ncbi:MAG: helix-turn-helix domain-containing protein [Desulfobacterales bacterium]
MGDYDEILRSLERQYPGQLLVGVKEVARIFGVSEKTVYNMSSRRAKKKFPVSFGRFKRAKLTDIAKVLAEM